MLWFALEFFARVRKGLRVGGERDLEHSLRAPVSELLQPFRGVLLQLVLLLVRDGQLLLR